MKLEELSYPIYRKRKNNRSFYKINSAYQFDEIQIMGTKYILYSFTISQYPEIVMLMEMIAMENDLYQELDKDEWEMLKLKTGTL